MELRRLFFFDCLCFLKSQGVLFIDLGGPGAVLKCVFKACARECKTKITKTEEQKELREEAVWEVFFRFAGFLKRFLETSLGKCLGIQFSMICNGLLMIF